MSIPGSNLLAMALSVINPAPVIYYKYIGKQTNVLGFNVSQYAPPITIQGSLQPVPRAIYQTLGLNFEKSYFTFYTTTDVLDLTRNLNGDQLIINGLQYHCESSNDWYNIDGWVGVMCILVGNFDESTFGFGESNKAFNQGNFNVG